MSVRFLRNEESRAVKAPPPTYPPEQVASAILASALHPKRERIVGGAGRLVTVAEAVAPFQLMAALKAFQANAFKSSLNSTR